MLKDKDIREPLFAFLEESYGRIRIIEEKNMGGSRADVIMVTPDSFVGIEIKSDADTYTRLAGQVEDYDRYFDMNIIVVGTRHAMHVEEHVPASWGIITVEEVEGRADFYVLRRPKPNPGIDPARKLSLLWRPELQHIVYRHLKHKYDRISKKDVIEKILPIVDNFERGLNTIPEDAKGTAFAEGMEKIYKQFVKTLDDLGVKPIEAVGKPFDPNFHNAVMHVEDENFGENIVAEEFQKGYTYRDSVVRHSMVKVAN